MDLGLHFGVLFLLGEGPRRPFFAQNWVPFKGSFNKQDRYHKLNSYCYSITVGPNDELFLICTPDTPEYIRTLKIAGK